MGWFNVDRAGLAAILERRGKFFALAELVSNAWDSNASQVTVSLQPIAGQPYAKLSISDNGEGFADLSEANTMFSRSRRGSCVDKRGRFNLGEKLVLAVCRSASITTTCGSLLFREDGTVEQSAKRYEMGTTFDADIRMTREEYTEVCRAMVRLIPPVATTFNGDYLDPPQLLCRLEAKLPTEIADEEGRLRRSVRLARVEVYVDESGPGEVLEMGIPVVETDNGYRCNVLSKIPLNMERDNVTLAFLKALQVALLNQVHDRLTSEDAVAPWVQEAAGDARAQTATVKSVITKRFGERAVIATPGDVLANSTAEANGYTVVPGGALSGDIWANVRKAEVLLPASRVFPSPKPEVLAASAETVCPSCKRLL